MILPRTKVTQVVLASVTLLLAAGCGLAKLQDDSKRKADAAVDGTPKQNAADNTVTEDNDQTNDAKPDNTATDVVTNTETSSDTSVKTPEPVLSLIWNGDDKNEGASWATPNTNPVVKENDGKSMVLHWQVPAQANFWSEWGYNWKFWQKPGTAAKDAKYFRLSLRLTGPTPPSDMVISLRSALTAKYAQQPPKDGGLRGVSLKKYEPSFADGAWHDVKIPVADFLVGEDKDEFAEIYEIFIGAAGSNYDFFLDNLSFEL
jgi:hypothetical protein